MAVEPLRFQAVTVKVIGARIRERRASSAFLFVEVRQRDMRVLRLMRRQFPSSFVIHKISSFADAVLFGLNPLQPEPFLVHRSRLSPKGVEPIEPLFKEPRKTATVNLVTMKKVRESHHPVQATLLTPSTGYLSRSFQAFTDRA